MPGHRARLPLCGVLVAGRMSVVVASRMNELEATGPVESALENWWP